ncbi:glycosyl hydrolase [Mucilaginibacter pineti]|nr:glycosyl hydrolase [Mucilaginibacter pineti]
MNSISFRRFNLSVILSALIVLMFVGASQAQQKKSRVKRSTVAADTLLTAFRSPPASAKPRVYWFWEFNRVTKEGITRDLEQFKAKGISGVNLICTGGYAGKEPLPGVEFLGAEWRALFRYAVTKANKLHIEIGFNLAGGWTLMGPSVTKDNAMKKVVSAELRISGPTKFSGTLPQAPMVENYYHDIMVQAFPAPDSTKKIDPKTIIDLTSRMDANGHLDWEVPNGKWVVLRTGYTLTGHPWSKWHAYPEGDTFKGGEGYEIDYLSKAAVDDYFSHLGKTIIEETKKAGGHLDYLWSDSWECGKLTWTQDFANQFTRFRGYDLRSYMPVLAGYAVVNTEVSERFREDFDRTIQDCIAENFYARFEELCHKNGLKVGNEAGGPNDIPPQDVLKNFGHSDILSGEFWVNGNRNAPGGYNKNPRERLNLKQTATAAHVYGKQQAEAEAFTEQEKDGTHWSLGPSDLKPYANDAFCEGINRFMLHQATCQPPSDGKPGYEFCAGQHFTPNITWWEQSPAFFGYLSRCQYMLQQGKFVGDVCFYIGERPPLLAPPKYLIPSLGPGYDCDYSNPEVLLTRMTVKNGRIVLPDGMSYKLLVLQNCTSPSPKVAEEVGSYQGLQVSPVPSDAMSLPVIKKIRELINMGATVVGPPPVRSAELKNYPECDEQVKKIAAEIWGELDGKTRTERRLGKGRVIWGKTPREILLADGVAPDFSFTGQTEQSDQFDYIHRTNGETEIYFVTNRTNQHEKRDFTFRVAGKQPEIWDAVTGKMVMAKAYSQTNARTTLSLELDEFSSYFIVFRKPIKTDAQGDAERNFPKLTEIKKLEGTWNTTFDPNWGGPANAKFSELISWTQRPEEGIKYYSGTATYTKSFDLNKTANRKNKGKIKPERLFLDLGNVKNVAEVRLNGKKLGILWCAPWRVEITGAAKQTGNVLQVDVINLWANRVVHDLSLPKEKRITKTHDVFRFDMLNVNTPLLESGLLGPVKVYAATNEQ